MTNILLSPPQTDVLFSPIRLSDMELLIENSVQRAMKNTGNNIQIDEDRWFDLPALCDYLPDKPAKATIYANISRNEIPYHKRAKKLYFLKSEIDAWLRAGRKKTEGEIQAESDAFLHTKIKRS